MKTQPLLAILLLSALFSISFSDSTVADTFGSGANSFDIEFVTIGDPGNAADTTGAPNLAGSVAYTYRISKFEISEDLVNKANIAGLNITHDSRGAQKPATNVSWDEAARFVNWLNTSSGYLPAYKYVDLGPFEEFALWSPTDPGYDPTNLFRNRLAKFFLPSSDEEAPGPQSIPHCKQPTISSLLHLVRVSTQDFVSLVSCLN